MVVAVAKADAVNRVAVAGVMACAVTGVVARIVGANVAAAAATAVAAVTAGVAVAAADVVVAVPVVGAAVVAVAPPADGVSPAKHAAKRRRAMTITAAADGLAHGRRAQHVSG